MDIFLIFIIIGALLLLYIWFIYNDFVGLRMRVKEAWSQIDVQLKRRADLIPNLVETVKGYVKHEKEVLENVTRSRSQLIKAQGPADKAEANNQLIGALKSLFAVAENYPKLVASENFLELQRELEDTEDKIAYSRQFYNTQVREYNTKLELFPNVLFARRFSFKAFEFFETKSAEKEKVKVKFN